jgi:glycosyltransferase involved in cell wall biosynthesis
MGRFAVNRFRCWWPSMALHKDKSTQPPVVAIVDWSSGGHNLTYFKHYARAALECGAIVLPIGVDRAAIADVLRAEYSKSPANGGGHLEPPFELEPSAGLFIRPKWLKAWSRRAIMFRRLGALLRRWERQSGTTVSVVFFTCMWDEDFRSGRLVSAMLRRPWAGVYLQAQSFYALGENAVSERRKLARRMFSTPGLVALGVLEPRAVSWLHDAVPALPVKLFPDVLEPDDSSRDSAHEAILNAIARTAGDRPVIALLGALKPSKGVELFLRAACDARADEFAFVLGGELNWPWFGGDACRRIQDLIKQARHLLVIPTRLTEAEFNAVLRRSAVIFAAYTNFPYSSNVQMKAAQLHKPMVVTDGTLMADRVRTYQLGECIPQDDLDSLVDALPRLASDDNNTEQPLSSGMHDELVAENSYPMVKDAMQWVLEHATGVGIHSVDELRKAMNPQVMKACETEACRRNESQ